MSTVAAIMIAKDCNILDYSPILAIKSVLPLKNLTKFFVNEGYSQDGTFEDLKKIEDPRVEIIRRHWKMDKSFWVIERNFLIEEAKKHADYLLIMDADEFLFSEGINEIEKFLDNPKGYLGMHFKYRHFFRVGDGNNLDSLRINENPGWYQHHAKLVHFSMQPRLETVGFNADDFVGTFNNQRTFLHLSNKLKKDTGVFIGHLGYARDAKAAGMKFKRNDSIYNHSQDFVEGQIPEPTPFSYETYSSYKTLTPIKFNVPDIALDWITSKYRYCKYND